MTSDTPPSRLGELLEQYFEGPLAAVPDDLRTQIPHSSIWDYLHPKRRRELVRQWDPANDPAADEQSWDIDVEINDTKREIREVELLPANAATEWRARAAELERLRSKLNSLEAELRALDSTSGNEVHLAPKPVPRFQSQELAILAKLQELGIDPLAVPRAAPGKASEVKRKVREALKYSNPVMNKAWQRLRSAGEIKDV